MPLDSNYCHLTLKSNPLGNVFTIYLNKALENLHLCNPLCIVQHHNRTYLNLSYQCLRPLGHHSQMTMCLFYEYNCCVMIYILTINDKNLWVSILLFYVSSLTESKHGSTLLCYLLRTGRTRVQIPAKERIINSE